MTFRAPPDRTVEYTLTTGTGAVRTSGPAVGYQSFASAGGAQLAGAPYVLESGNGTDWETGTLGTVTVQGDGTSIITRVFGTSSTGSLISLSGNSRIFTAITSSYANLAAQALTVTGSGTSSATPRWLLASDGTAETGSNAGTGLNLGAYSDAGSLLGNVLSITRASGQITFQPISAVAGQAAFSLKLVGISGAVASATNWFDFRITADTAAVSGTIPSYAQFLYQFGGTGTTGGRAGNTINFKQVGTLTPDGTKQPTLVALRVWNSLTAGAGGSTPGATYGLAYGANFKTTLGAGALYYTLLNGQGETNWSIAPSSRAVTLTASPSVTVGDTISLTFTSASLSGSPLTITQTATSGDTVGYLTQRMAAAISANDALDAAGIGVGYSGATDATLPNVLTVTYPAVMNVGGTLSNTDFALTSAVSGTETLTLGTITVGASTQRKYGASFVSLGTDGARGTYEDVCFSFGKQSKNQAPTSGTWQTLFKLGGGGSIDDAGQGAIVSQWPLSRSGTVLLASPQSTTVGGAQDGPIPPPRAYAVIDFMSCNFTLSGGFPLRLPGFALDGTGVARFGAGYVKRNQTAGNAGPALTADGYEGTTVALNNGGGSGNVAVFLGRYYVGDIGTDAYGGQYQVTAISNTGAVTAFTVLNYPSAPAGSAPGGTGVAVAGGSGNGWTVNITWTAGNTVTVGASGQTIALAGTLSAAAANFGLTAQTGSVSITTATSYVGCNTAGNVTVTLPAAPPAFWRGPVIKDETGGAGSHPITLTVNGTILIDAATTFLLSQPYGSVTPIWNGTKYLVT